MSSDYGSPRKQQQNPDIAMRHKRDGAFQNLTIYLPDREPASHGDIGISATCAGLTVYFSLGAFRWRGTFLISLWLLTFVNGEASGMVRSFLCTASSGVRWAVKLPVDDCLDALGNRSWDPVRMEPEPVRIEPEPVRPPAFWPVAPALFWLLAAAKKVLIHRQGLWLANIAKETKHGPCSNHQCICLNKGETHILQTGMQIKCRQQNHSLHWHHESSLSSRCKSWSTQQMLTSNHCWREPCWLSSFKELISQWAHLCFS